MKNGYTIAQVARVLGLSSRTVKRRVNEGIIPAKSYGPRSHRIEGSTVVKLKQFGIQGMTGGKQHGYKTQVQTS